MKYILLALLIPILCGAMELETENYKIKIESSYKEGEVSCSNYVYIGNRKKSGNSIELKGSSWHTLCLDGVTPCRFLGYKFKNGNITYYVGEDGLLEVVQGRSKVLLSEEGEWQ